MNRNTIWAHLAIAMVLILIAAFAGRLHKWQKHWTTTKQTTSSSQQQDPEEDSDDSEEDKNESDQGSAEKAEVLVRFRPGITQQAIEAIALIMAVFLTISLSINI